MRFDWSVSLGPVRRLTMLVLICAKDLGVPRIQPYELAPGGVPRQHPLRGQLLRNPKNLQLP